MFARAVSRRAGLRNGQRMGLREEPTAPEPGPADRQGGARPRPSGPPGVADQFLDLLEWLDPPQRRGLISRLSNGFYEDWRPGRGEVADLVAAELGVIDWDEQLHRSRQRKTGDSNLAEFTVHDFAEHRRRQVAAPTHPSTSGRPGISPAPQTPRTGALRLSPITPRTAATSRDQKQPPASASVITDPEALRDLTAAMSRPVQDAESFIALAELATQETVRRI